MPSAPLLALAYVAGTMAAAVLGGPWWASMAVAAAGAGAWRLTSNGRPALVLVAAVALVGASHARWAAADGAPAPAIASIEGAHVIEGLVSTEPTLTGAFARFDVEVSALDGLALRAGGVRVTVRASSEVPRAGDLVRLSGDIERPPEIEEFDYAAYLRSAGIHAVVGFPQDLEVLAEDAGAAHTRALRALRRGAVTNIERALPEPAAALATGMLAGERRAIPGPLRDALRITGTSHLVVVSGQNVALLLGSAIALLTLVTSRRRAALVTLALLPAYVALVGGEPPVVRAALMAVGIALGGVLGRRTPGWVYLAYAVALMLALDPGLARSAAFQLSASATAGVLVIAPPLRDALLVWARAGVDGTGAALAEVAATAAGAALAVLPVQIATFEAVAPLTLPANVLVAPLYEGTVAVALLAAAFGWFEPAADVIGAAGRLVPETFALVVEALAGLPGAQAGLPASTPVVAAVALAGAAAAWALHRGAPRTDAALRGRQSLSVPVALAVVAFGLWSTAIQGEPGLASVTVLDVGQGLAVLVEDGGNRVLIDVGPPDASVLAALPSEGLPGLGPELAAVVITHGDADHAGALPEVLRRLRVRRVLAGGLADDLSAGQALERLDIGDRLVLSDRTWIEVLSPPVQTAGRAHTSDNNGSLVLMVHIGERRVLLPPDIEAEAEEWLVTSGQVLRADVLVAPHHGSVTSSTPRFLDAVSPAVVVFSVGAGNRFGHPVDDVVARTLEAGARIWRTDDDGSVALRSDGTQLWVSDAR